MTKKRPGVSGQDRSRPLMPNIISRISPRVVVPNQSLGGSIRTSSNSVLNGPDYTLPLSGLATGTIPPARMPETTSQYSQATEIDASFSITSRYYGPTSFSSVFTENDLLDGINHRIYFLPSGLGSPLLRTDISSTRALQRNQIVLALSDMPSQDMCESLMGSKLESHFHITLNAILIKHAVAGLWSTFGELLSFPRTTEKLNVIADALFKNEKQLSPAPGDGIEWLSTYIGPNLRFEMLGLLFCFFGMAYQSLLDGDYRLSVPEHKGQDRKQLSWRMKECADICLKTV